MRRASLVLLILASGCAGARHPSWNGGYLCETEKDLPGDPKDPMDWVRLLLRGFDPATRRATSPAVDCTGAQVRWDAPALMCADATTAKVLLPDRPLTPDDVIVSSLDDTHRLVWVVTSRYASGDGLGPVAVVQVKGRRLVVRAIGNLRANVLRAKLRLEPLGNGEALVAEGEFCASADPASCNRTARVMPYENDRFWSISVTNDAGGCLAPAWFHLAREESERLPSGWRRRYRLDGALRFAAGGVTVQEQVVVHDVDPRNPAAPERLFRRAESEQVIRVVGSRLLSEGTSLWNRIMAARQ